MNRFTFRLRRSKLFRRARVRSFKRTSKKPFVFIPVATVLGLTFLTFSIFGAIHVAGGNTALTPTDSRIVIVSHDKKKRVLPTTAKTVDELLTKMEIKLGPNDVVEPARDTEIVEDNFNVNVYRALPVTVIDGNKKVPAISSATTPRSIARQAGVSVFPEDKLQTLPTDNFLQDGGITQKVVIERATPVNVNLYGTNVTLRTHAKTVGELLDERNIKPAKDDTVQPAADTSLEANPRVFVTRKGVQIQTAEEQIAMPVETVQDATLSFGSTAVRQQGSVGKKLVTYEVQLQNGKEVSRKLIQEVIAQAPVTQIVAKGKAVNIPSDKAAVMTAAGISVGDQAYVNYIVSRESGWNAAAANPSGAFGLCQSLPGSKMASAGSDWQSNPVTQLRWCNGYATGRYGTWAAAYDFWVRNHWW